MKHIPGPDELLSQHAVVRFIERIDRAVMPATPAAWFAARTRIAHLVLTDSVRRACALTRGRGTEVRINLHDFRVVVSNGIVVTIVRSGDFSLRERRKIARRESRRAARIERNEERLAREATP